MATHGDCACRSLPPSLPPSPSVHPPPPSSLAHGLRSFGMGETTSPHARPLSVLMDRLQIDTNPMARFSLEDRLRGCVRVLSTRLPQEQLWREYSSAAFGISPPGRGVDCHRTWEMLYFGMIPIVLSSSLDPMFQGLPVVIVKVRCCCCRRRRPPRTALTPACLARRTTLKCALATCKRGRTGMLRCSEWSPWCLAASSGKTGGLRSTVWT